MSDPIMLVSPDDHVVAPPHLWQDRLPERFRAAGPRVVRERGRAFQGDGWMRYEEDEEGVDADVWLYDDRKMPLLKVEAAVGLPRETLDSNPTTYDEILPGTFQPKARLDDMDAAGVAASVCFPNMFVRFCGQQFLLAKDKELALACVQAYNDFLAEEWCADSEGRLVPMSILPLWDADLALAELLRNAERGFPTFAFAEQPHLIGLPSIYSGHWDRLFAASADTGSVVSIHLGTGGLPSMAPDAPGAFQNTMAQMNMASCLTDWLFCGLFERYPGLRISLAESQAGWVPYLLHRADSVWHDQKGWSGVAGTLPRSPSEYFRDHVFVTFFKDDVALRMVDQVGPDNLMYEVDYPHTDTSWPTAAAHGQAITSHLEPNVARKVLADNARRLFRLEGVGA